MKPILFNSDMVRAILDGRKTVTRRLVKPQPYSKLAYCCMGHKHGTWTYPDKNAWKYWDDESYRLPDSLSDEEKLRHWTPPCHHGDILYVRETWAECPDLFGEFPKYVYRADYSDEALKTDDGAEEIISDFPACVKWRPSIHMPKEAARIFLRVTDVQVEMLQDITEEGSIKEGFEPVLCNHPGGYPCTDCMNTGYLEPAMLGFVETWNSTIKKADRARYGWDANPWCWVIEFERISREEALKCG